MRRVVRHPDGSKNKICQRAPVLESQWQPSSNCHCCPAVTLLREWLQEQTSRKTSELESLRQFVVVLNLILVAPATSLVLNCNGSTVPLDPSPTWREGGGRGMLHGQQPVPHITLPRLTSIQSPTPTSTPGEDTPASPSAWTKHGEQRIPVISHCSIGVERGARRCSRRWERSSDLTGQLSPASGWKAPSQ